jgi:hypothetical protein
LKFQAWFQYELRAVYCKKDRLGKIIEMTVRFRYQEAASDFHRFGGGVLGSTHIFPMDLSSSHQSALRRRQGDF